ncbi:hypothetical protein [Natrinema sp. 74]|uniref:hypothetical protein n=1 Tax=Natrinema sp. 74 TaxID=3384159 RepID=UPI0038D4B6FC
MGERDRSGSDTTSRRGAVTASERARRIVSRLPGGAGVRRARRLWRRYAYDRPEQCQLSVTFPTAPDRPTIGRVYEWIADLEVAFEGRLDVYARQHSVTVVTDRVPIERVDLDALEETIERIESGYAETHSLAHLEKVRPRDGQLVRSDVVVPVKPLFPREQTAEPDGVRSAAD